MPLVLICPGCKTRLTVGADRAGTTFGCPRCALAISVPLVSALPPIPPRAPAPPLEIKYAPEPPVAEPDDETDPDYRPRHRRKARRTDRWVVLGVVLLLAGPAVLWFGARSSGDRTAPSGFTTSGPSGSLSVPADVSDDGPDWTYQELLDHLRTKGLKTRMRPFHGDQLYVLTDTEDGLTSVYWECEADYPYYFRGSLAVLCAKMSSAKAAKDAAGRHERGTFHWGRYYFRGPRDGEAFLAVRKVLLGR